MFRFFFKLNLVRTQTVLFLFYCLPAEVSVHFSPITASEIVKQTQSTWISADVHTAWLTQFKRACTYHNHMSDLMCNASSCLLSRLWMVTAGLYLLKCACVMPFYCNVWHFLLWETILHKSHKAISISSFKTVLSQNGIRSVPAGAAGVGVPFSIIISLMINNTLTLGWSDTSEHHFIVTPLPFGAYACTPEHTHC